MMKEEEKEKEEKQTLDSILGKWSKGKRREEGLKRLAELLKEIECKSRPTLVLEVGVTS